MARKKDYIKNDQISDLHDRCVKLEDDLRITNAKFVALLGLLNAKCETVQIEDDPCAIVSIFNLGPSIKHRMQIRRYGFVRTVEF